MCRGYWIGARHRAGRPPRIGATVQTLDAMLEAVGAGLGVAATVEATVTLTGLHDEIAYRPLPELDPLEFWVARRTGDERPRVAAFMDTAVAALAGLEVEPD